MSDNIKGPFKNYVTLREGGSKTLRNQAIVVIVRGLCIEYAEKMLINAQILAL